MFRQLSFNEIFFRHDNIIVQSPLPFFVAEIAMLDGFLQV